MLCLWAAQLKFWFQTALGRENSASYYRHWRQLLLTSRHGYALVTLCVQFLCSNWSLWVHAENLRSILKVVNLTLTAEVDRVLCQLVMFQPSFFYWMYKKWNSAAIKSLLLFVASLFFGFLVEKYVALSKSEIRFGMASFSLFTLLEA